jgi:lysophospholipase L1-like esterase
MTELAQAHGIKVILSAVMPTCDYIRNQSGQRPNSRIIELNTWIREYAAKHNAIYLDYFTPMLDDQGALKKELTYDGLHPNDAGYELIMPLAQRAIDSALK